METFSKSNGLLPKVAHFLFQIPFRIFGLRYKNFLYIDKAAKQISWRQGRPYDLDLLRHTLTLAMLLKQFNLYAAKHPILIIGDGYANMASVILESYLQARLL